MFLLLPFRLKNKPLSIKLSFSPADISSVTWRFAHNYLPVSFASLSKIKQTIINKSIILQTKYPESYYHTFCILFWPKDIFYNHIRITLSGSSPFNLPFHPSIILLFQRRLDPINCTCNTSSKSISCIEIKRIKSRISKIFVKLTQRITHVSPHYHQEIILPHSISFESIINHITT